MSNLIFFGTYSLNEYKIIKKQQTLKYQKKWYD